MQTLSLQYYDMIRSMVQTDMEERSFEGADVSAFRTELARSWARPLARARSADPGRIPCTIQWRVDCRERGNQMYHNAWKTMMATAVINHGYG
jgi:hypothetical protein